MVAEISPHCENTQTTTRGWGGGVRRDRNKCHEKGATKRRHQDGEKNAASRRRAQHTPGPYTDPGSCSKTTASNSLTIFPLVKKPRSPPLTAEGHCDFSFANWANLSSSSPTSAFHPRINSTVASSKSLMRMWLARATRQSVNRSILPLSVSNMLIDGAAARRHVATRRRRKCGRRVEPA